MKRATTKVETEPTYESSLTELEAIVHRLETGDLPLEESLDLFERGVRLYRVCHDKLAAAERRVEVLLADKDGTRTAVPFADDDHLDEE